MNEIAQELLKRADVIGAWLSGTVTKAADFATEQAIDIAMQYVMFGRVYSVVVLLLCLMMAWGIWKISSYTEFVKFSDGLSYAINLFQLVPLTIFFSSIRDTILVWFAPKVWLIIELAQLAKGVK